MGAATGRVLVCWCALPTGVTLCTRPVSSTVVACTLRISETATQPQPLSDSLHFFCVARPTTYPQWLLVLLRLTHLRRLPPHEVAVAKKLLDFLLLFIQEGIAASTSKTCVGLLINLCRQSPQLRDHVRALPSLRKFYRALVAMLSDSNVVLIISSLSLLASLLLGDSDLSKKLFNPQNIGQVQMAARLFSQPPINMVSFMDPDCRDHNIGAAH